MKIKEKILIAVFIVIMLFFVLKAKAESASSYTISQATVDRVNGYNSTIDAISKQYGIPARRIKAHIAVESAGDPNATGSIGEVGLMQITEDALTDVNRVYFSYSPYTMGDMKEPVHNINACTAYLHWLHEQLFDYDKMSMAYNVGIGGLTSKKTKAAEYLTKIKIAESKF